ncbi:hypothetical protein AB0F36_36725, partial [Streptomyces sp. NPDC029080]|uniref:hypothetical protein n=1 Tax=Streptomyces sp. NPDC029080 TaxID=3155017 RepID=UPI00340716D1
MAEQKSSALTAPLRGAASVLRRVPGTGTVNRAARETLDKVGAVSPRGRRLAVYAGAGVLGVAGVVEWPVAVTGAAVAWLTQPRPGRPGEHGAEPAHDLGTAALRSGAGPEDRTQGSGRAAGPVSAAQGMPAGAGKHGHGSKAKDHGSKSKDKERGLGH